MRERAEKERMEKERLERERKEREEWKRMEHEREQKKERERILKESADTLAAVDDHFARSLRNKEVGIVSEYCYKIRGVSSKGESVRILI